MKRDHDGHRLWSIVAATVRPFPGRSTSSSLPPHSGGSTGEAGAAGLSPLGAPPNTTPLALADASRFPRKRGQGSDARPPDAIEPNRFHRLTRGRSPAAPTLDLHHMTRDRARAALTAFILRAHAEGERTVLVITGKGALGDGVLRRQTPEWLAEPPLRPVIAGLSEAHPRHGGGGALYVALKRVRR